jgi:choline dehydrogenase-like flavoprotein
MSGSPDVAVVGGGIVGLAAADALALRGARVVVLERFAPGSGQSAGAARGFRHLHGTPAQIAAAVRARALWDAWSARAGEPLVGEEGALRLGRRRRRGRGSARRGRRRGGRSCRERGARLPALHHEAGRCYGIRAAARSARRGRSAGCSACWADRVRRAEVVAGGTRGGSRRPTGPWTPGRWCSAPARAPSGCGRMSPCGASCTCASRSMRRHPRPHRERPGAQPRGGPQRTIRRPHLRGGGRGPAGSRSGWPSSTRSPRRRLRPPTWWGEPAGLDRVRARLHDYAQAAFPGLGPPVEEGRAAPHGAARR